MTQRRTRSISSLVGVPVAAALVMLLSAASSRHADPEGPLTLQASLSARTLNVMKGDSLLKQYEIAVGHPNHPTPQGTFTIHKLIWNPAWVPPAAKWAQGKKPAGPGESKNPMKTVKIFFQEPDYYIHGTGSVESLGEAASHGCLRMDPDQAAELALLLMDNSGQEKDLEWVKGIMHLGAQRVVSLSTPAALTIGN